MKLASIALLAAACGGTTPAPTAPTTPPAEVVAFTPTSFVADVKGHGRAVILIPGLGSPGAVWDDTVAHWAGKYETHVLTLAGFAGRPPIDAPLSATVKDELAKYIAARKLDHPIVIGHSMGGFIAYWLAATAPELVGPVVIVDGAPNRPGDPAEKERNGRQFRDQILAAPEAEFLATSHQILASMSAHPERLERFQPAIDKSDRKAFASAFYELMTTDLEPMLPKITAPVLVVLADAAIGKAITEMDKAIPHHRVETIAGTKHFVMIDDPEAFYRVVDAFLAAP
jgi:N-formylmaleamate deformylase